MVQMQGGIMLIKKNRDRSAYSFANINLLGKCNANCYFCLGKDLPKQFSRYNQLNVHFHYWRNFNIFLDKCKTLGIAKLYITGQTADGLQYKYLGELIDFLQKQTFIVGLRTNGYLALKKMTTIQKMRGEIGYSIHSLRPKINKIIMGKAKIPNWGKIIPLSGDNVRISIVLTRYNISEFWNLIKYLSTFPNIRYIQIRRISTDTRYEELREDIEAYENFYYDFVRNAIPIKTYEGAPVFKFYGKEIVFWRTVETTANSLNYFTDGTVSDEYFVIEGYLKYKNRI